MGNALMTLMHSLKGHAKSDKLWGIAYLATLLIPWLLISSRGAADAMCVVIGVCFLGRSFRSKQWLWLRDPVVVVALAAWAWMLLVASPFAVDVGESYKVALPWIRWILLYASFRYWLFTSRESFYGVAANTVLLAVAVIFDTFWQYHFGVSIAGHPITVTMRLTGPFTSPKVGIYLDKICFPVIAILLFAALESTKRKYIVAVIGFALLCFTAIVLSGERTATFSFFIGISVFALLTAIAEPKLRVWCLGGLVTLAIITAGLFLTQVSLQLRFIYLSEQLGNFRQSSYGSLFLAGYLVGISHWLTGAGFKGFRLLCPDVMPASTLYWCNIHPHNPYIEWFAELGAMGEVLFVIMILSLIKLAVSRMRTATGNGRVLANFALATLVVHFLPFLGTQSFFSNWPAMLLWYSVSLAMSSLNLVDSRKAP